MSGIEASIKVGNTRCRCAISRSGTIVHCVEMQPGRGAQIGARGRAPSVKLLAREGGYAQLRAALRRDPPGA